MVCSVHNILTFPTYIIIAHSFQSRKWTSIFNTPFERALFKLSENHSWTLALWPSQVLHTHTRPLTPHAHTRPHTPHMLPHSTRTHTGSLFLKSSVDRIQSFMSRFSFQTPLEDRTATYLQELLNPRGDKTTLEAQKIQEYVRVCLSNMDTPTDTGNNYSSVY